MKSISTPTILPGLGIVAAIGLAGFAAVKPIGAPSFEVQVEKVLLENPDIMVRAFAKLEQQQANEEAAAEQGRISDIADDLFARLDATKPILVELLDYNCGYCRRAHETVVALRRENPDLQYVRVETPILGAASTLASEVALTVHETHGAAAYDRFANALMTLAGPVNPTSVRQLLTAQGFDAEAILEKARAGAADAALAQAAQIARRLGANGTPVFVGPSGMVRGAGSGDELMKIASPAQS